MKYFFPKININSLPRININSLPRININSLPRITLNSLPRITLNSLPRITLNSLPRIKINSYNLNKMKNYSLTKLNNFNMKLPRVKLLRRKDKILTPRTRHASYHSSMSNKTKDFLHRLCNKKTPPVDMTQYGFMNDKKMHPTNVINPVKLKAQFNRLIGRPTEKIIIPRVRVPTTQHGHKKSYGYGGTTASVGPGDNRTTMSIQAGSQPKQARKIFG